MNECVRKQKIDYTFFYLGTDSNVELVKMPFYQFNDLFGAPFGGSQSSFEEVPKHNQFIQ